MSEYDRKRILMRCVKRMVLILQVKRRLESSLSIRELFHYSEMAMEHSCNVQLECCTFTQCFCSHSPSPRKMSIKKKSNYVQISMEKIATEIPGLSIRPSCIAALTILSTRYKIPIEFNCSVVTIDILYYMHKYAKNEILYHLPRDQIFFTYTAYVEVFFHIILNTNVVTASLFLTNLHVPRLMNELILSCYLRGYDMFVSNQILLI